MSRVVARKLGTLATLRKHRGLVLMALPVVAFFIVFSYIPMYGLVIAFKDFSISEGILGGRWIGLENFATLFGGDEFPQVIRNTLVISLLRLVFGFAGPIVLALLINEVRLGWYKRTVQTLTYLPYFFSWVLLAGIFRMLLARDGAINSVICSIAGPEAAVPFLTSNAWFIAVIIITAVWQGLGYGAVIYLAALSGISPTLYEAAVVDGAGRWKQTLHITLPALVPTMVTLFILSLGGILNVGFDQIYNMYNPNVYEWGDVLDTYVIRLMQEQMDFAGGAAAGMFKSVVSLVLIVLVNSVTKKISKGEQGIW
ncbi:MAG: ABC transporter permease subunit [Planctomycetaceae bacterium]|nr:ABC transporter permease subunit [Planctomycetaceae bacterium]